jgi:hypothetical protein
MNHMFIVSETQQSRNRPLPRPSLRFTRRAARNGSVGFEASLADPKRYERQIERLHQRYLLSRWRRS